MNKGCNFMELFFLKEVIEWQIFFSSVVSNSMARLLL